MVNKIDFKSLFYNIYVNIQNSYDKANILG